MQFHPSKCQLVKYSSTIWDPYTNDNIHKIEMAQRRAARFVMSDFRRTNSVNQMLTKLQWTTLNERRAQTKCIMMYRIVNHLVDVPTVYLIPTIIVSGHSVRFLVPFARTCVYQHSFFTDAIRLWNGLLQYTVDSPSLNAFSERLAQSTNFRRQDATVILANTVNNAPKRTSTNCINTRMFLCTEHRRST